MRRKTTPAARFTGLMAVPMVVAVVATAAPGPASAAAGGSGAAPQVRILPHTCLVSTCGGLPLCPVINGTTITTPYVTAVSPSIGPSAGNTDITITGFNFTGCETDGTLSSSTSGGVTTLSIPVTLYQFSVYGVELSSTGQPQINEGAQTVSTQSDTQLTALTPPGPLCTVITAMNIIVDAMEVTQSVTYQSINGGTTWFVGQSNPPSQPSPIASTITTPPVQFTYQNEGPQPIACASGGTPYDLAGGNAIVRQMADELTNDVNIERTSRNIPALTINQSLVTVAEFWADQEANGNGGAGPTQSAAVTASDACILQEVAASGFSGGGSVLWAAENGGAFGGVSTTAAMNAAFVKDTTAVSTTTAILNGGSIGGAGCQQGAGGTSGVNSTSPAHNIFSQTFTSVGVAVACSGGSSSIEGACFAAEVFAGSNPVQPDCADVTPTQSAPSCGAPAVSTGGTQGLDVLPGGPTAVQASLTQNPGSGYQITVSWHPPPAQGYDPVTMYADDFTDDYTAVHCVGDLGANLSAFAVGGCFVNGSLVPVTTDQYTVSVRASNDLCQGTTTCFPEVLYPPPVPPTQASTCVPYGDVSYPSCSGDSSEPDGPWALASPDPVVWKGPNCNPSTVTSGCKPPQTQPGLAYRMVASDGGVFTYGQANFYGSMGGVPLNQPMVGIASTADSGGYWTVAADGGIFTFGDAPFFGSMGGRPLAHPIVGMAATPDGNGYWLFASDGGIFGFGDARFLGSPTQSPTCNSPGAPTIVGMAVSPDGQGYWLVSSSGYIYAYGDAACLGSATSSYPVVGISRTVDGRGYWMANSNGTVYAFGDATATYHDATGSASTCVASPGQNGYYVIKGTSPAVPCPVVIGMEATPDGGGYWLLTESGGVDTFGDATQSGSPASLPLARPVIGMEVG